HLPGIVCVLQHLRGDRRLRCRAGQGAKPAGMSMVALHFRAAKAADLDGLLALVQSAYRGESSRAGWTTEADLLDGQRTDVADLQACLARADSMLLVAERPGDVDTDPAGIVACAYIAPDDDNPSEAAQFGMFAVRPQLQGSGVGKDVM